MSENINRKFEMEFYREGNVYRVDFLDVDKQQRFRMQSVQADLDDTKERRLVLDQLFGALPAPFAQVVRLRLFPSDTRSYEKLDDGRYVNPKYPEDNICLSKQ